MGRKKIPQFPEEPNPLLDTTSVKVEQNTLNRFKKVKDNYEPIVSFFLKNKTALFPKSLQETKTINQLSDKASKLFLFLNTKLIYNQDRLTLSQQELRTIIKAKSNKTNIKYLQELQQQNIIKIHNCNKLHISIFLNPAYLYFGSNENLYEMTNPSLFLPK